MSTASSRPKIVTLQATSTSGETVEIDALASPDPTASTTQRNRFNSRFTSRWRTLRGEVRSLIRGDKQFRPMSKRLAPSAKVVDFRDWLEKKIDQVVVEPKAHRAVRQGMHWTGSFVQDFYLHGIRQADRYLSQAGLESETNSRVTRLDPKITVRRPPHKDVLYGLYVEAYHDLVDAAAAAKKEATRAYREAVRSGSSVSDTINAVNDRLDKVGRYRTDLVAESKSIITINTAAAIRYSERGIERVGMAIETVRDDADSLHHTHCCPDDSDPVDALQDDTGDSENDGEDTPWLPPGVASDLGLGLAGAGAGAGAISIDDRGNISVEGEVTEPEFSWVTAGDQRVCPTCIDLAGSTYSISDVLTGNAPMPVRSTHPSCRCALIPS